MEDMITRQLLGCRSRHLLPADDANVVGSRQLLGSGVRVEGVHVVDGSPRQDHIVKCLLERPHRQVHWTDSKEGKSVDPDHDDKEEDVEEHPD